jgi:GntR family carbon starvation induced transcriptional regulator
MAADREGPGLVELSSRNLTGDPWSWSSDLSEPPTRAQWVDQRLRQAILSGALAPDERLITAMLCERFSVSPTPLREALQRLAAEGLVELTPQRGARVAALSARDWLEIIELRAMLEPRALQDSFAHASGPDFGVMERAREVLAALVMTARAAPLELAAANRALHHALLAKATSRQLTRMITVLNAQSMRYHVLALAGSEVKGLVLSHDEVLRLALDERDPDPVAEILSAHLSALRGAARLIDRDTAAVTPGQE